MIKTYLFTPDGIKEDVSLEKLPSELADSKLLWVDARAYSHDEFKKLAKVFGLHDVAVRSAFDGYNRPHLYEFKDHFYVNLTLLKTQGNSQEVKPSELHLFVGKNWIITAVKDKKCKVLDDLIDRYRDTISEVGKGPMYAVYLIAEDLVENYYPVIEQLDDAADSLETAMLERADKEHLRELFDIKRHVFELRKLLGPQRDVYSELSRRDFPFIEGEDRVYFQDVYSRINRLFDMLDTIRDILSGSLDIYLSSVSNHLNEVMKVLTVLATVLGVLTLITGFYGMNFVHLPWLHSPNAFRNIMMFMLGIVAAMLGVFKWKKWI